MSMEKLPPDFWYHGWLGKIHNSCIIKISDGDRTDEVVDQDGIITEIPLYASKQIANRLNDVLTI